MTLSDRIHGNIEIKPAVIVDLINSAPLARLKKISQDGAPHFIQPRRNITRFEHSVGVWYLAARLNRPLDEQVACLLHDIPHTAFSHVADLLMEDKDHEYHERFHEQIVLRSEIPAILKKHGLSLEAVLDTNRFPLLENKLPDLSFDRWDYFMRDGFMLGLLPGATIDLFLSQIKQEGDFLYFDDERLAAQFAVLYMNFSRLIWLDPTSHGAFFLVARALKLAMQEGIVTEEDLFTTDDEVWAKLRSARHSGIDALLDRLSVGREFVYAPADSAEFFGPNKPRHVDPLVRVDNSFPRVSDLVPNLKYYFEEFDSRYRQIGVNQL